MGHVKREKKQVDGDLIGQIWKKVSIQNNNDSKDYNSLNKLGNHEYLLTKMYT